MTKITEGDKAPQFSLPCDNGENFDLSENIDPALVLFFYPKDDTSGCTAEAIDFTQNIDSYKELGVQVVGMSPDPIKKHLKFIAKHELGISLISDEEKSTLDAYGIWLEKSMYGRKYMGVERTTLLINADGVVVKAWHKVKVPGHVDEVLEATREYIQAL